jgi:Protein of unknown function (DUF1501)
MLIRSRGFIKASTTIGATHDISVLKLNTGDLNPGRPSFGAWVTYALGSANPDLPAYVVLYSGQREPSAGSVNWSSGFLPAVYQGTAFRPGPSPILHLERPETVGASQQRDKLNLLRTLNEHDAARYPHDTELQARLNSYELAYRMERSAPEAVDVSKESDSTKALYGLDDEATKDYGITILRARRLVEHGVRFIQVITGPVEVGGGQPGLGCTRKSGRKPSCECEGGGQTDRGIANRPQIAWLAGGGVKAGTTSAARSHEFHPQGTRLLDGTGGRRRCSEMLARGVGRVRGPARSLASRGCSSSGSAT